MYRIIIKCSQILVHVGYFLSFQLDVSQQIKLNLPLFNFLHDLAKIFKKLHLIKNFVLGVTILQQEEGLQKENIFHFGNLVSLIEVGIKIDNYSLENSSWLNYIFDLEVFL